MHILKSLAAVSAAALIASAAPAAVVDFEDLGVAPGSQLNTPDGVPQNSGGFTFTPGPDNTSGLNDLHFHNENGLGNNGSTHMGTHDDVVMTRIGGGVFSLQSFDFTGFITETDLSLVGEVFGGGTLNTAFMVDGVPSTYQTFNLAGWNNLVSVTWSRATDGNNGFFLDNITVDSAVPEPATWAMMILGFGMIGSSIRARRAKAGLALA